MLSMLFWGMSFVWTKIVFEYYQPITTVFLRLLISSTILLIVLKISGKLEKIHKLHIKLLFLTALFEPFLYFLGENFGLRLVDPTIASVIIATIPVFTSFFAFIILREKLNTLNILGLILSFIGIIVMVIDKNLNFMFSPKGIALLFLAVFAAVGYGISLKKLSHIYSPFSIITYQNIIGLFLFLPLFLIFDFKQFIHVQPTIRLVGSLLQLSVFASSLAFICWVYVIKHLGVSKSSIFTNLIPIITAVFSFIILNEIITINKIFGIIIVLSGVSLSQVDKLFIKFNKK